MKRNIAILVFVVSIAAISTLHRHLIAQTIVEAPPVASPTYVAIPPRQQEFVTVRLHRSTSGLQVSGNGRRIAGAGSPEDGFNHPSAMRIGCPDIGSTRVGNTFGNPHIGQ